MGNDAKVSILTLVGNIKTGEGPGHSALVLHGGDVYSFERAHGPFDTAWVIFRLKTYLDENAWRPVLVQELNEKVDARQVSLYVMRSIGGDADYVGSGVCSTQVAYAIAAGLTGGFEPWGIDTPRGVFDLAKKLGIVRRTYYYWPGKDALNVFGRQHLKLRMEVDYKDVPEAPVDGILARAPSGPPVHAVTAPVQGAKAPAGAGPGRR